MFFPKNMDRVTEDQKLVAEPLAVIEAKWPRLFMALTHHRTTKGEQMTFADKPWLSKIYKDNNSRMVIIKCSQVHMTEHFICAMFTLARQGLRGLYIMPTNEHRRPFVSDRINGLRDNSPKYENALHSMGWRSSDSNVYKSIFGSGWKFVGANVRKNFFEFPADVLVMDEYDLLDQDNVPYAYDRIADSKDPHVYKFGNPTIDGSGIAKEYEKSTQNEWLVKCCHCNTEQVLDWYDHFVEPVDGSYKLKDKKGRPICLKCKKPFDRCGPGRWFAYNPDSEISGYRISRLFVHKSDTDIVGHPTDSLFVKFLEALGNETLMQNFHNNYLGLTYESFELRLTETAMQACAAKEPIQYKQDENFRTVAGIDQGRKFTIVISAIVDGVIHDIAYEICDTWDQVHSLLDQYNTTTVVVDAQGGGYAETRKFIRVRSGAWMCYYRPKDQVKDEYMLDYDNNVVRTNRTEICDSMVATFKNKKVVIPHNWKSIVNGSYYSEMQVPKRIMDAGGNIVWTKGTDHFFHATVYRLLAKMVSGMNNSASVKREAHVDMMTTGQIDVQTILDRGRIGDPDNGDGQKEVEPVKIKRSGFVG